MSEARPHATARWRRLDGPGEDRCRLIEEPGGWMLWGHARFERAGIRAALDYVVRCNARWESRSADVTGRIDGRDVAWKITRDPSGWLLGNDRPMLPECTDIDLAFTPATNLLPLRRLALDRTEKITAAWFQEADGGSLSRLSQSYTPLGAERYAYASPNVAAELRVHPTGFVTLYPGLWEGSVDVG